MLVAELVPERPREFAAAEVLIENRLADLVHPDGDGRDAQPPEDGLAEGR